MIQFPFLAEIHLDRSLELPLYLQITKALSHLIKKGMLSPGQKLPSTRLLSKQLQVHRSTIMVALEELQAEGWLVSKERSGWYVNHSLPIIQAPSHTQHKNFPTEAGIALTLALNTKLPEQSRLPYQFNDGIPDYRLAPLAEFGRAYTHVLRNTASSHLLNYGSPQGDEKLIHQLCKNMQIHRSLSIDPSQMLITRGSVMGVFLLANVLMNKRDKVVVGELSYHTANYIFQYIGAQLLRIPVDKEGLVVEELEQILQQHTIKALYVTSHHHYPTTVPLAPHRRLHLYQLAQQYRFFIIEDDYDYDFHYANKPLLPIASMDTDGLVCYVGSFSKKISPAFRIGFVVAPQNVVAQMIQLRRMVDRQGSNMEERALAELLADGTIKRYTRKALNHYHARRNLACSLLKEHIGDWISFDVPEGGMAIWAHFHPDLPLQVLSRCCAEKQLYISSPEFWKSDNVALNACRMGFASSSLKEIEVAVAILQAAIKDCLG